MLVPYIVSLGPLLLSHNFVVRVVLTVVLLFCAGIGEPGRSGEHRGYPRAGGRKRSHDHLGRKRDGTGENDSLELLNS